MANKAERGSDQGPQETAEYKKLIAEGFKKTREFSVLNEKGELDTGEELQRYIEELKAKGKVEGVDFHCILGDAGNEILEK